MSRDVLTAGSTMRISLLYRGEYSQWVERFMNYLEEQTDREAMINLIKNDDQPLPRVTQVSIAGTSSTEQPPLKEKSMWYEKRIQKIDRLAICLLIQGLLNDTDSLIDSNKTAKDLWDALARHMLGSEYGKKDRKAAILYEYETFKATKGELLLDTYIRYLQSANKKQEFVKSDDKKADEKKKDMSRVKRYNCKKEGHFAKDCKKGKVKDYEYYKTKMMLAKKDKDEQVLLAEDQAWMESSKASSSSADEKTYEVSYYLLESEDYDKSDVDHIDSEEKDHLVDKLIIKFNKKIVKFQKRIEEANQQSKYFENQNKDLQDKYDVLKNKTTTFEMNNKELNEQLKELIEKNNDFLAQTKVIGLGYTLMFLTHSDEALEIEKFKRSRENKIEFAYDYGNLNASYVNEKINLEDDYFQDIINPDFEKIDSSFQQTSSLKPYVPSFESSESVSSKSENQTENDCLVVEKECDKEENPKVIAPGTFKLSVSQRVLIMSMLKTSCDSKNVEIKLKRKRRKRKSTKQNVKQVDNDVSRANNDFVPFSNLDTFSIVRRPKNNGVIWKKKGSSNTSNVGLSAIIQLFLWIIDSGCSKHMTGHNLFSVGQFCDKGLEVAFRKSTCFARNKDGVDLLTGLPKIKFEKDHLCFVCEQGKIHQKHHKSKTDFSSNKLLYLLHMDLCGPMCVQSINVKRYVLVVVDDYSWYTWVFFLHSKDEASEVIISFIKKTQVNLQLQVQCVRTDNGTEFKNKILAKFFDEVGITQQFSAARMPQQNGVVERRNRTLVKAARTMLSFLNLPSFLWAEAITTACFTQNRSIIHKRFNKTPYELINKRKPNIKFFRVFGCRCYLLNDYEDIGNLKANGDI
nr:retrovirus-related Pol polyprotein from transposon TNT 1-94 [Tanacetum cinerariifolium]